MLVVHAVVDIHEFYAYVSDSALQTGKASLKSGRHQKKLLWLCAPHFRIASGALDTLFLIMEHEPPFEYSDARKLVWCTFS
jgi:hypothetical protein